MPSSPVAAVQAAAKRSTPSTSPLTPGTSAPAARSAATRSAVASSGTTASSSSKGGVRNTAPRTSPPSSYHPNSIGSSDQRRPARTRLEHGERDRVLRRAAREQADGALGVCLDVAGQRPGHARHRARTATCRRRSSAAARPRAPRRAPTACGACCRARAASLRRVARSARAARRSGPGSRHSPIQVRAARPRRAVRVVRNIGRGYSRGAATANGSGHRRVRAGDRLRHRLRSLERDGVAGARAPRRSRRPAAARPSARRSRGTSRRARRPRASPASRARRGGPTAAA